MKVLCAATKTWYSQINKYYLKKKTTLGKKPPKIKNK